MKQCLHYLCALSILALFNPAASFADAPAAAPTGVVFSGHVDAYYSYNFNNPVPVKVTGSGQPAAQNALRNYDLYSNSFTLNRAELTVKKTNGQAGFRLDLNFGSVAETTNPSDEVTKNIRQAFVTYTPAGFSSLTLSLGKMATHMGYELTPSEENWNYSRSLGFVYAIPVWHNGLSAAFALIPGKVTATAYIYNGWNTLYETNRAKTLGFQLLVTPTDAISLYYNLITGAEKVDSADVKTVHEAIATYTVNPSLAFAADLTTGSEANGALPSNTWKAAAFYSKFTVMHKVYMSPRVEFYSDPQGYTVANGNQSYRDITLTTGIDLGDGLETRLEFRQDHAGLNTFTKGTLLSQSQVTGTAGFLYSF